jgi:hypothetical protein
MVACLRERVRTPSPEVATACLTPPHSTPRTSVRVWAFGHFWLDGGLSHYQKSKRLDSHHVLGLTALAHTSTVAQIRLPRCVALEQTGVSFLWVVAERCEPNIDTMVNSACVCGADPDELQ